MQLFMPSHQADVITVEQPVDLLAGQWHQFITSARPTKFFFCQAFVIQHKPIVLPVQALDLVPPPIGKSIQAPIKWVMSQFLLDNGRKTTEALAEIHWLSVQVDIWHIMSWPEILAHDKCARS